MNPITNGTGCVSSFEIAYACVNASRMQPSIVEIQWCRLCQCLYDAVVHFDARVVYLFHVCCVVFFYGWMVHLVSQKSIVPLMVCGVGSKCIDCGLLNGEYVLWILSGKLSLSNGGCASSKWVVHGHSFMTTSLRVTPSWECLLLVISLFLKEYDNLKK